MEHFNKGQKSKAGKNQKRAWTKPFHMEHGTVKEFNNPKDAFHEGSFEGEDAVIMVAFTIKLKELDNAEVDETEAAVSHPFRKAGEKVQDKQHIMYVVEKQDGKLQGKIAKIKLNFAFTRTNQEPIQESIQDRLEKGETPLEIVKSGVAVEELYGKKYQGGFIFYLNTDDGTGMIAAPEDAKDRLRWAYAKKYCEELEAEGHKDWSLPKKEELNLMYTNLKANGNLDGFAVGWYWSSTEEDLGSAWLQDFNIGDQYDNDKGDDGGHVRAARAF